MLKIVNGCRICSGRLETVLSLVRTPLANSFLDKEKLSEPEAFYPLNLGFCPVCGFVQLLEVVSPEIMFKNYIYVSSTSDQLCKHFETLVDDAIKQFNPPKDSLIVEMASNDGTLLKNFKKYKVRTLGVEPAENIAPLAEAAGIETVVDFFTPKVAEKIAATKGKAAMIIGTNVFAHIDDLKNVMKGFQALLDKDGVIIIESPYLVDLLDRAEYDTIYHEHLSYLSLTPLLRLFSDSGLRIFGARRTKIHGGSIRIFACRKDAKHRQTKELTDMIELEKKLDLGTSKPYVEFALKVQNSRVKLLSLLYKLKSEGKRIAGYGAAAKGNTLLNYCNIGPDILDYIVDKSPHKQGKYTPGTNIPVVHPDRLLADKPDYVLILAWNFAEEIMKEQHAFRESGGKFIIPVPEARVI